MNRIKENYLPLLIGVIGLGFLFFGFFQILNKPKEAPLVIVDTKIVDSKITVDIEGAVIKPGVYTLSAESRIVDALAAAGGMGEEADRYWVEKNINMASKASDGLKIYIPRVGEEILSSGSSLSSQAASVMNINTASQSDLESLPGVGEITAQNIISARPFSSVEDVLDRKIIGQATFEKIKDKIAAN